jgi:TetR/AcrR family transcriptional regulator, transcriptional repressor for nem operon
MNEMTEKLLDTAEAAIRARGYHAVSFRELADELGIKSASVHYYYRQKEDLGLALVARYEARFFHQLNEATVSANSFDERLRAFIGVYRAALVSSDSICLCGMLGAESSGLPHPVGAAVAGFFKANVVWLIKGMDAALPMHSRRERATTMVAALQGAMMIATSMKDHRLFDMVSTNFLSGT